MSDVVLGGMSQLERWFEKMGDSVRDGYGSSFADRYRNLVGFVRTLAADASGSDFLELLRTNPTTVGIMEVLSAIDQATEGLVKNDDLTTTTPLFNPPIKELEHRVCQLGAYLRLAPTLFDKTCDECPEVIRRSTNLRDNLRLSLSQSTDSTHPIFEAATTYVFGSLFAATAPKNLDTVDRSHSPLDFELLFECQEAVLNFLRYRYAQRDLPLSRRKAEKFGILDSPDLREDDLNNATGVLGVGYIYFDIDGFKPLNTKYGETVVDKDLLPDFQRLIVEVVGSHGFAYQEGGDEFTVLCNNATKESTVALAAAVFESVAKRTFTVAGETIQLTVSVGIAHVESGGDRTRLRSNANLAMREAKKQGKNRIFFFAREGPRHVTLNMGLASGEVSVGDALQKPNGPSTPSGTVVGVPTDAVFEFKTKRDEWLNWVSIDPMSISNQIYHLVWNAAAFKVINRARQLLPVNDDGAVEANGLVQNLIDDCFFESELTGIRRLMDEGRNDDVISLRRLIRDFRKHRHLATRENIFKAEGRPYDFDKAIKQLREDLGPNQYCAVDPNPFLVKMRHLAVDKICGVSPNARRPSDQISEAFLRKLELHLATHCRNVARYTDKYIAKAADSESRSKFEREGNKLLLKDVWEALGALARVTNVVYSFVLGKGEFLGFLAVPQYNQFEYIERPIATNEVRDELKKVWDDWETETRAWGADSFFPKEPEPKD
jgi:diguanylate cyclase (GGDEF)-like protein